MEFALTSRKIHRHQSEHCQPSHKPQAPEEVKESRNRLPSRLAASISSSHRELQMLLDAKLASRDLSSKTCQSPTLTSDSTNQQNDH